MLLGAQTKYLIASPCNLETPLTKTKGTPHFLSFSFYSPPQLSPPIWNSLPQEREEKISNESGYTKARPFLKWCPAFSQRVSEDAREMVPFFYSEVSVVIFMLDKTM